MDISALVPELWRRYPFLEDEHLPVRLGGIKKDDVARWATAFNGDREQVYDAFGRYFALAFHQQRLPFAFCDAVMNDLEWIASNTDDRRPVLFLKVYFAFDAGEYHRAADRSDDPVATHTVPAIAAIVAGF
jgi:hypothetical protein